MFLLWAILLYIHTSLHFGFIWIFFVLDRLKYLVGQAHPLRWRNNGCDGVSNHQPHHCLLDRLFGADQRKHQSSASLALVWGPVNCPHKWPVTRKMFPFDDVIMVVLPLLNSSPRAVHRICFKLTWKKWNMDISRRVVAAQVGFFCDLVLE